MLNGNLQLALLVLRKQITFIRKIDDKNFIYVVFQAFKMLRTQIIATIILL